MKILSIPLFLPLLALLLCALVIFSIGLNVHYTNIDQVYFADPAINYVLTGEYKSTAWGVIREDVPHVSTAPLYSFLLILWFKIFEFDSITMRFLPSLFALFSAFLLCLACRRLSIVTTPVGGALLVVVFLMDFGFTHSYTCGRPDALSSLIAIGIFYLYSFPSSVLKNAAVLILGALIPFTQYGLAIYLFALALPLIAIYHRKILPFSSLVILSIIIGFLLQYFLYKHLGVFELWIQMIRSEGSENIIQRVFSKLTINPLENHGNTIPKDFSAAMLFAGISIILFTNIITKNLENNFILGIGLVLAIWVTTVMYIIGKFPTYYGWMLALPLSVALAAYFERERARYQMHSWAPTAVASFAVMLGLPLQAGLASFDWSERTPSGFDTWIKNHISEKDMVYCEYPFYFSVKKNARKTYVGRYWEIMTEEEKSSLDVVILGSTYSEFRATDVLSQHAIATSSWVPKKSALLGNNYGLGALSAPNYQCTLYRLK